MFAKRQPGRAAAGERHALHFEKRNNVLVEFGLVLELVDQIEKDIGREGLQFLPQQIEIVEDGQMLRCVAQRAERGQHVRLGLPIFRFQLLAEILVDGRRTCAVEERENFEFLFHVRSFRAERSGVEESRGNTLRFCNGMSRLRST